MTSKSFAKAKAYPPGPRNRCVGSPFNADSAESSPSIDNYSSVSIEADQIRSGAYLYKFGMCSIAATA